MLSEEQYKWCTEYKKLSPFTSAAAAPPMSGSCSSVENSGLESDRFISDARLSELLELCDLDDLLNNFGLFLLVTGSEIIRQAMLKHHPKI